MRALCVIYLILNVAHSEPTGSSSVYYEIHPSTAQCKTNCNALYPPREDSDEMTAECGACCLGCNAISQIGVISQNGEVQDGIAKCESMCGDEFEGYAAAACKVGCKQESEIAKGELEKWQSSSSSNWMMGDGSSIMDFFNQLNSMFDSMRPEVPTKGTPSPTGEATLWDDPFGFVRGMMPGVKFATFDELSGDDAELRDADEDDLFGGLLGRPDGHNPMRHGGMMMDDMHHGPMHHAMMMDEDMRREMPPPPPPVLSPLRREQEPDDLKYQMRAMLTEGHTVQVLLIVSISACLVAVVWLLLNSGNDPIVQINNHSGDDKPPAYEAVILDEDMKKKQPILIVAEAPPPLPKKAPIDLPASMI